MIYYKDFNAVSLDGIELIKTRDSKAKETVYYYNVPSAFDCETTSMYVDPVTGETITNAEHNNKYKRKNMDEDKYNKFAFMYIWMFGIGDNGDVYYGRTWAEFKDFMNMLKNALNLSHNTRLICYIHNMAFDFQFMRKEMHFENVFATAKNMPLKALSEYGVEFRDSLRLAAKSLDKVGEELKYHDVKKKKGDLDYSLIRNEKTVLTDTEIGYCTNDITVLTAYIAEQMMLYGDITHVPLTNTGRVRQYSKDACFHRADGNRNKENDYRARMKRLIMIKDEYILNSRAKMGGFTHANLIYVGRVLENVVSIDFTSSYPAVMLLEQFPMSKGRFVNVNNNNDVIDALNNECCIIEMIIVGLKQKEEYAQDSYISVSKCYKPMNPKIVNGRLLGADKLAITITNVDFEIIRKIYTWKQLHITRMIAYKKGPLPREIKECIIQLYKDKTTLKGVKGKEIEYMVKKGMLNSLYGMMLTDTISTTIDYEDDEWIDKSCDKDAIKENLDEYNNNKSRFLFYPWGVFVTAYARRNLWQGILEFGNDYVYSDTDSIKCLNYEKHKPWVERYNENVKKRCRKVLKELDLPLDSLEPETNKGIKKPIGVWDDDGEYRYFKTLGAKRYIYYDDDLHVTVAGLNKKAGKEFLLKESGGNIKKAFDVFSDGLFVPEGETGKNTHLYINDTMSGYVTDYQGNTCLVESKSGVHLEETSFTVDMFEIEEQVAMEFIKGEIYMFSMESGYDIE